MAASSSIVTRFAPSPTGPLHLGHAYAALLAWHLAQRAGGQFLLRIEDLDQGRSRPDYEAAIFKDLHWLGLSWPEPVMRQSARFPAYEAALARLEAQGLLYPCFCTRAEITAEIAASAGAPHPPADGPEGPVYPGTCRHLDTEERIARIAAGRPFARRLDMAAARAAALEQAERPLSFVEHGSGTPVTHNATPAPFGDVVLARKEYPASYHLAVVVDDAAQGVTLVTRGEDLASATHLHRLLQALLGLPAPDYHHHRLITDETGRRLAKRDDARSLGTLRAQGLTPEDIRERARPDGWPAPHLPASSR